MLKKISFAFIFVIAFSYSLFAQSNTFEGYNIILSAPENHKSATCAIRYAPPRNSLRITDLNRSTPMNVKPCNGSGSNLVSSGSTVANLQANPRNGKWCFQGEDKKYRVEFVGDQFMGRVTYDWVPTPKDKNLGFYNIRDFGAVGDGVTDDTIAIRSALAFIATRNGGILKFPEGDYLVTSSLTLPSGITIQGVNGIHTGASTNNIVTKNPSRIRFRGSNSALFKIGECMEKILFKDIELYSENSRNTYGVEAVGAYTSTQDIYFENVTFHKFFRGIYAHGLPQTKQNWQFDYIKVTNSRFIFNTDTGIYCDVRNSDWKIQGSLFINPRRTRTQKADSMHFERAAGIVIQDTFGGGFPNALGGTYLNVLDSGGITVIGSQTENMTNSFIYNEVENVYAGDYSYPITFIGSGFANPVIFKARRNFVSMGNSYGGEAFQADSRLRVYSTGDRFCYDGFTLACAGKQKNNFDKATVIFMTGQPSDGRVQGHPTYFGTDVQFGTPVQMPAFRSNQLPNGKPNGSMIYCSDCRRDTTPCRGGGSGSPAMVVSGRWSCL